MKTILFPTDFSETAQNAFRNCLGIAKKLDAHISVLHIYNLPDVSSLHLPTSLAEIYQDLDLEEFENYKDRIPELHRIADEEEATEVTIDYILKEGHVDRTILETIKQDNYDLVVMGTQGHGFLSRVFLGSSTTYIMENSPIPVIGIPTNVHSQNNFTRVSVSTKLEDLDYSVMDWLIEFISDLSDIKLFSVHVNTNKSEAIHEKVKEWEETYSRKKGDFDIITDSDYLRGIDKYVAEKNIDTLVMVTHRKGTLNEIFNKSVAKEVIYQKNTSVLAVPERYIHSKS